MRFSMSLAGHAGGEILGAFEAGSNEPDAVAIAFPPNTNSQDEISIRAALRDVGRPPMWASPRAWDADAKSRHVALARAGSELHHHATEGRAHWYLNILGTNPAKQGSGAGTALMDRLVDSAGKAHVPLYLETAGSSNQNFY